MEFMDVGGCGTLRTNRVGKQSVKKELKTREESLIHTQVTMSGALIQYS